MPAREEPDDGNPQYLRIRRLGWGIHGTVWLAHRRNDPKRREIALKYIPANTQHQTAVMREVRNHLRMRHHHIVSLYGVSVFNGHIVLEMDALHGGDMLQFLNKQTNSRLSEEIARWYFQQMVMAVEYCHRKGVCNRDIKLENILLAAKPDDQLTHPIIKICDFGWSKDGTYDSDAHSQAGTPAYVAPEILSGGGTYSGELADSWSLGVILYVLVVGRYPFMRDEDLKIKCKTQRLTAMNVRIENCDYEIPEELRLSPEVVALIGKLLTKDPVSRLKVTDIWNQDWTFIGHTDEAKNAISRFNDDVIASEDGPGWRQILDGRKAAANAMLESLVAARLWVNADPFVF